MANELANTSESRVRPYLEYLDKEMTIMGVLSGFAVGSVVLVMHAFTTDSSHSTLVQSIWDGSAALVIVATAAQLVAALFFYKQRSVLAWHYGQLCLALFSDGPHKHASTRAQLDDADSWATWIAYRIAFASLCIGYAYYGVAVIATRFPALVTTLRHHPVRTLWIPIGFATVCYLMEWMVLTAFAYEDRPWYAFWHNPNSILRGLKDAMDQNRLWL